MENTTNFLIRFAQQGGQAVITSAQQVVKSLESVGQQAVGIGPKIDDLKNKNFSLAGALAKVGERAVITIPIWMALRGAFLTTTRAFDDSVKSIIDMDTALKHLEMQLIGTANAAQILSQVKTNSQSLALQTGEAPATLIDVYNQLVTVGFSVQDAFKGMDVAAKGALVTNTDSADITNTLINVYKELGSSITAVHSPAEKLNYIMDTMTVLMQKNHISIQDFEAGLKTFAGQAAVSNLTLDQTLSLLASEANVSQTGQFAGRGLSGIFRQITNQRSSIEDLLGKPTSGQSDWQTFQDVLTKIQSIKPTDTAGVEAITKIFSLRGGGQAIRALAEDAGHLTDNLKLLYGLTPDERQEVFMGRLSVAMAMVQHQMDMTKQSIEALGRSFIEGLAGTTDYAGALAQLNGHLNSLGATAKTVGEDIRILAQAFGIGAVAAGAFATTGLAISLAGAGTAIRSLGVLGGVAGTSRFLANSAGQITQETGIGTAAVGGALANMPLLLNTIIPGLVTLMALLNDYNRAKSFIQNSGAIAENQRAMEALNAWQVGQSHIQHGPAPTTTRTVEEALNTTLGMKESEGSITDEKKNQALIEEELKSLGYDKVQILQYELSLLQERKGYNDYETQSQQLQLELAKNINQEKKSRNIFDSDDTKLFKIAQRYGTDVAQDIGTVLQDSSKYNILNSGEQSIFAKQFASYDTSRQATEFFRQNPQIPINNQSIRNQSTDAISGLLRSINVTNHFNVKSSTPKETAQEVMYYITNSMQTPGSQQQRALAYQQNGNNWDDSRVPGS